MKLENLENLCKIRSNTKTKILINREKIARNGILCEYEETLETMKEVIYAEGFVVTKKLNGKPKKFTSRRVNTKPRWKEGREKEINELRGEVSILDELMRGVKVKSRILNTMKKKDKIKKSNDLTPLKETLKQKIELKAQRLRRYEKRTKFYRKNNILKTDKKKFYRKLGKSQVNVEKPPSKEEVETFWTSVWGTENDFNNEAE